MTNTKYDFALGKEIKVIKLQHRNNQGYTYTGRVGRVLAVKRDLEDEIYFAGTWSSNAYLYPEFDEFEFCEN